MAEHQMFADAVTALVDPPLVGLPSLEIIQSRVRRRKARRLATRLMAIPALVALGVVTLGHDNPRTSVHSVVPTAPGSTATTTTTPATTVAPAPAPPGTVTAALSARSSSTGDAPSPTTRVLGAHEGTVHPLMTEAANDSEIAYPYSPLYPVEPATDIRSADIRTDVAGGLTFVITVADLSASQPRGSQPHTYQYTWSFSYVGTSFNVMVNTGRDGSCGGSIGGGGPGSVGACAMDTQANEVLIHFSQTDLDAATQYTTIGSKPMPPIRAGARLIGLATSTSDIDQTSSAGFAEDAMSSPVTYTVGT